MLFLLAGIVMLVLWYGEIGPVATWAWYVVFAPFGLAVLWWWWADATGYTKKKAMDKENARKKARIEKSREAMGITPRKKR